MITPISKTDINFKNKYGSLNLSKKMQAEKLQNLIKEFEEQAKKQPNNTALRKHIEYLKQSLQKFLP